jgi:mevalonate kinase
VAVYSGAKRKTADVVREMQARMAPFTDVQEALFHASEVVVMRAVQALQGRCVEDLGRLMQMAQGLMAAYGVNTPRLQALVDTLHGHPACAGAKISGSGLGDCVMAVGIPPEALASLFPDDETFFLQVAEEGLSIDTL